MCTCVCVSAFPGLWLVTCCMCALNARSEVQADGQAYAKNPPPFYHTTLFSLGFCVSFAVQPVSYFETKIDPSLANLGIN